MGDTELAAGETTADAAGLMTEAKTGTPVCVAAAAVSPTNEGPLPPTNGSTSVITAVNTATSNADRFFT
ncbi:hypothetical protein GCM10027052_17760 [Parafrigoribacterium mesophilum]